MTKKKKKGKKEAPKLSPKIARLSREDLLALLIANKKGMFGNAEEKLKKELTKKLGISEKEAFDRGALLAYVRRENLSKKLEDILAKKAKEEVKNIPPEKIGETLTTERLIFDLLQVKKGRFGSADEKLKKDMVKRLKIKPGDAFRRENLIKYSKFKDIAKELKKIHAEELQKKQMSNLSGLYDIGPGPKITDSSQKGKGDIAQAPSLERLSGSPEQPDKKITQRADRISKLLEEKKRLEEQERKKKGKKKEKAPGKKFASIPSRVSHAFLMAFATIATVPISMARLIAGALSGFVLSISRRTGRMSPFGWKKKVTLLIIYSGIDRSQEEITGLTIINGAILAAIVAAAGFFMFDFGIIMSIIAAAVSFILVWIIVYSVLNLMADKRSDEVEGALPDILQIVSANISAGMTPYNALWVSARKEFGALAEEIKVAQKETLGGKAFNDALTDMGERVRSNILKRTVRLIIQGMKAGGELPHILQGIGSDIRQMRLLQKEMAANTMSYVLFIMFGMLLGAPLLFSVSIQFVDIMNKFQPDTTDAESLSEAQSKLSMSGGFSQISVSGGSCPKDFDGDGIPDSWEKDNGLNPNNGTDAYATVPGTEETYLQQYRRTGPEVPESCVSASYLSTFAMVALSTVAFFGSLLVGLIRNGKQSAGVKLMPLIIPATLGMFWLMNTGMSMLFGSMFGA
jgi:hypothetical protein